MGAVKDIYDILLDLHDRYKSDNTLEKKNEIYRLFIQPSYQDLQKIHQDYLEIFNQLCLKLSQHPKDIQSSVEWLGQARLKEKAHRTELEELEFEGVLDDNLYKWDRTMEGSAFQKKIEDYGLSLNRYFIGNRGLSHSAYVMSILRVIQTLTKTIEDITEEDFTLSGDPFDALSTAQNYIIHHTNSNISESLVKANIRELRILKFAGCDMQKYLDSDYQSRLKEKCGYSYIELHNESNTELDDIYCEMVLDAAIKNPLLFDEHKLKRKDSVMLLEDFIQSLIGELESDEKTSWETSINDREYMKECMIDGSLWSVLLNRFIQSKVEELGARFTNLSKSYQEIRRQLQ